MSGHDPHAIRARITWHKHRPSDWTYTDPPEDDHTRCGGCGRHEDEHPIPNTAGVEARDVVALLDELDRLRSVADVAGRFVSEWEMASAPNPACQGCASLPSDEVVALAEALVVLDGGGS